MKRDKRKISSSALQGVILSALVILFFVGLIVVYAALLRDQMMQKIVKSGELSAAASAEQINEYLSTGIETIKLECYSLNNMIRNGKSQEEIRDFLVNQSAAVTSVSEGSTNGLYGYINGEYLDGTSWMPDDDYVPTERPWYIEARANIGRVAVVNPYVDALTGTVMLTLSKTLCDAKSVVAVDFSLDRLQTIVEDVVARENLDEAIVLDQNYRVIAHSDQSEIGKNYMTETDTVGHLFAEQFSKSNDGYVLLKFGSGRYVANSVSVANEWYCISVYDATSDFAQLRNILLFTVAAAFLVVFILLFILIRSNRKTRLARELNEKTERAVAASEAKSAFLSNMSHEIRTPINAMLGMNEMVLRESENKDVLMYSESIKTAGNTLLGIVNDILDFSKIEAGKMEIIPVDYDLSSVINDLVNMVQKRADDKDLVLKLDFDRDTPRLLNGDEVRVKQVVTNILTNAVKYTEKGSVTFRIGYERIPEEPDSVFLHVSVRDTGIGIRPEDIEKLFSEFERIEEKRNRSIEGTGLGMSITKHLLEMMDSRLEVESVYGEGSAFSFRLKQKVVRWDALGDYEASYHAALSGHRKYREKFTAPDAVVLVVDDMPMNLAVFKSLLKRTGVQIDTAASGDEGLALAHDRRYDMIFLDHMMPHKDGVETLRELRAQEDNPNLKTPTICLTANAISGAREQYLAAGFDDYLTKPIDADKLEEMLMQYLPKEKLREPSSDEETAPSPALPDWLRGIDGLDAEQGLSHCGSEETYLETLTIYAKSAPDSADEIESLWNAGDLANTTVKVHAIKSLSRAIGAEGIGALAEKLEFAGKAGDAEAVGAEINDLLARIRTLCVALAPLRGEEETAEDESLPPISDEELAEAYEELRGFAAGMDAQSAKYVFDFLAGYRLPPGERKRVSKVKHAIDSFEWEQVGELLNTQDA